MKNYTIKYSFESENDLDGIYDYIAIDNPKRALEFVLEIKKLIEQLSSFPETGRLNKDNGLKYLTKEPYFVYYTVDHATKLVYILTVYHAARQTYQP